MKKIIFLLLVGIIFFDSAPVNCGPVRSKSKKNLEVGSSPYINRRTTNNLPDTPNFSEFNRACLLANNAIKVNAALKQSQMLNDNLKMSGYMFDACLKNNDLDSAEKYLKLMEKVPDIGGDNIGYSYIKLGGAFLSIGEYNKAVTIFDMPLFKEVNCGLKRMASELREQAFLRICANRINSDITSLGSVKKYLEYVVPMSSSELTRQSGGQALVRMRKQIKDLLDSFSVGDESRTS